MEITEELVKSLTKEQYNTFSKEDKKEIQRIKAVLRTREYYKKNPEKNGYRKDYYHKNKDKINERNKSNRKNQSEEESKLRKEKSASQMRRYRDKNRSRVREVNREYYRKNKEAKLISGRKSYKKNKHKYKKIKKDYRRRKIETDINFKISVSLRSRFKKMIFDGSTSSEFFTIKDAPIIKKHLESQFKEGMSWDNYGKFGWHIDHIIPLSSFDLTDKNEIKIAFHYLNLQPLWAYENLSKGNNIPDNAELIRKCIIETIDYKLDKN